MPWCEPCAKYFVPNALTTTGCCPKCGALIAQFDVNGNMIDSRVTARSLDLKAIARADGEDEKAPWHFKLLVVSLVVYLAWRFVSLFI